jgi:mRNA interferase MazF
MTACARQGDILWLEKEKQYVLVLSRDFFNQSGMSVVCPLRERADPDALHIMIHSDIYTGTALIEHLRSLDLQAVNYRRISGISYEQIRDISDAVQGIFDFQPCSI